jgi:hypothetical protein
MTLSLSRPHCSTKVIFAISLMMADIAYIRTFDWHWSLRGVEVRFYTELVRGSDNVQFLTEGVNVHKSNSRPGHQEDLVRGKEEGRPEAGRAMERLTKQ